ncbi:MAG: C40 family peptidase [Hyphomicrobiaceae bacterium]|nr:C40 family peptidase [Hyphomicrobiaceae bacterium]
MTKPPDPRTHPYRADLAAEVLRGVVPAPRYVEGALKQVAHGATPLWSRPDASLGWASQLLHGELVRCYEEKDGWAWVQALCDSYVGYVHAEALSLYSQAATHRVTVPGTFVYAAPDAKALTGLHLAMNALVCVAEPGATFARLAGGGFVPACHLGGIDEAASDFVAVAEQFVGTPYVWGGKTRLGLDCSGLVQVAMHAAGGPCPRDSDLQMTELGTPVETGRDLDGVQRGDLIFWKDHVAIVSHASTLLHANAHRMAVASEPLRLAVDRIAKSGSPVVTIKRPATPRAGLKLFP